MASGFWNKSLYAADGTMPEHHPGPGAHQALVFSSKFLSNDKQKLKEMLILSVNLHIGNMYSLEKKIIK